MFERAQHVELPEHGVLLAVSCNSDGANTEAKCELLDVFSSILVYLSLLADIITENFGMDSIQAVNHTSAISTSGFLPYDERIRLVRLENSQRELIGQGDKHDRSDN